MTPLDSLPMPKLLSEMGYEMRIERAGYEPVTVQANLFVNLRTLAAVRRSIPCISIRSDDRPQAWLAFVAPAHDDGRKARARRRLLHRQARGHEPRVHALRCRRRL